MNPKTIEELTAEVERLTGDLADRDKAFGELKENHEVELKGVHDSLNDAHLQIVALQQSSSLNESENTQLSESLTAAVESYKSLLLTANPGLPQELIGGDSVESLDASVASAQALVDQVKQTLAVNTPISPGAPVRTAQDLTNLSGEAKIKHALTQERS